MAESWTPAEERAAKYKPTDAVDPAVREDLNDLLREVDRLLAVSAPTPDHDLAGQFCGQTQPHDVHRWVPFSPDPLAAIRAWWRGVETSDLGDEAMQLWQDMGNALRGEAS